MCEVIILTTDSSENDQDTGKLSSNYGCQRRNTGTLGLYLHFSQSLPYHLMSRVTACQSQVLIRRLLIPLRLVLRLFRRRCKQSRTDTSWNVASEARLNTHLGHAGAPDIFFDVSYAYRQAFVLFGPFRRRHVETGCRELAVAFEEASIQRW
jgi:hypothetical protein